MENPAKDIYKVFNLIDCVHSPDIQKAAIEKYFLQDAGFKYPVFQVEAGPKSRDKVLKLYQWLHIISPKTKGVVTHVTYDKAQDILLLDVTQHLSLRYLPMWPSTSRMLTRLTLKKQSGLHYIAYQEDLMHPDDVAGLLLPPLKTIISLALIWMGTLISILSMFNQRLGIFVARKGSEDDPKAHRRRKRANKNGGAGESAGIEDSSSMKMEMESLNATSAKILRGNGKRAEQVGEDTGRNMAPLN